MLPAHGTSFGPRRPLLSRAGAAGDAAARTASARLLARTGWTPSPDSLLFAGRGQQALSACFTALIAPGERLGFEAMTYPLAKGIAQRLGLVPTPIAMDAQGLRPDALAAAGSAVAFLLALVISLTVPVTGYWPLLLLLLTEPVLARLRRRRAITRGAG